MTTETLRLRPGVYRAVDASAREYLLNRSASQSLGRLTDFQRDVLRQLAEADSSTEWLRMTAYDYDSDRGPTELDELLDQLRAGGWLYVTVVGDGRPAYTIEPHHRPHETLPVANPVLSRFAVIRRTGTDLLVESPLSWCAVRVHDLDLAALLATLVGLGGAAGHTSPLSEQFVADLARAGIVVAAQGQEEGFELRQWSPYELWFHHRIRGEGMSEGGFGRTKWAAGQFPPLPARRPSFSGPVVQLPQVDLDTLRHNDLTLTEVLESRRSLREHDDQRPITAAQIGEFLYRSAGIRQTGEFEGVEYVTGPNPSGGALDPLEFYVAVRLADGIEPGLYRYNRFDHRLESVCGLTRPVRRLISGAQGATVGSRESPQTHPPQLVIVTAARFGRVGWSYETLTYSLILKLVGVAYQTMYCVATAMGLAPCALGAGEPAAFAEATGLDPLVEAPVGEFILGSRP